MKVVPQVQRLTWTMINLQLLVENTIDSQDSIITSYKKFPNEIAEKESEKDNKTQYFYSDVNFKKFQISETNVRNNYISAIHNTADCMEEHFFSLYESLLFKHIATMC